MRLVIIPAYNEEKAIGAVIQESLKHSDKVIVVDNNSFDETFMVAVSSGAEVIECDIQGAGAATRSGIKYALKYNPDIIVTIDSDGQHDPSEIDKVCELIENGKADVVIGSRFISDGDMPKYRKLGNDIISIDYNYYSDSRVKDTQSCFRAFTRDIANKIMLTEDGFGFSTEFLIKARKLGARIAEVPIHCIYFDDFAQNSTLNPLKHGVDVLMKTEKWRVKEDFWSMMRKF
jgi:glycosyltransferase involved in cell wall biosynthesis